MKSFTQFLSEAPKVSRAVEKAKRLGLVSDGHGNWYDREGNYRGRTEKGDLVLTKGRGPGKEDAPSAVKAKATPEPTTQKQTQVKGGQVDQTAPPEEAGEEESKGTLTVAFGRFNPPTIGHEKLLNAAGSQAKGGEYKIYPSRSQDAKKNPLSPDEKISYMRQMYPKHSERIVNDGDMKTIFDVLKRANEDGYGSVNIMVGADRKSEFEKLANKYNGELYDFEEINVVSAGERDPDAEGVEGMSASKMRKAAAEDDFSSFRSGIPNALDDKAAEQLFNTLKRSMKVATKEQRTWEIAPKLDGDGLRENFFLKRIFNLGDLVENLNTGLRGRIIRRGANHLICVTEDEMMFKSWIRDVGEAYTEKKMERRMRVPGKPNTLEGTGGYLKNAMAATGLDRIKNFINKYKKS